MSERIQSDEFGDKEMWIEVNEAVKDEAVRRSVENDGNLRDGMVEIVTELIEQGEFDR